MHLLNFEARDFTLFQILYEWARQFLQQEVDDLIIHSLASKALREILPDGESFASITLKRFLFHLITKNGKSGQLRVALPPEIGVFEMLV